MDKVKLVVCYQDGHWITTVVEVQNIADFELMSQKDLISYVPKECTESEIEYVGILGVVYEEIEQIGYDQTYQQYVDSCARGVFRDVLMEVARSWGRVDVRLRVEQSCRLLVPYGVEKFHQHSNLFKTQFEANVLSAVLKLVENAKLEDLEG